MWVKIKNFILNGMWWERWFITQSLSNLCVTKANREANRVFSTTQSLPNLFEAKVDNVLMWVKSLKRGFSTQSLSNLCVTKIPLKTPLETWDSTQSCVSEFCLIFNEFLT